GPSGRAALPAGEFFEGLFETALQPGELLTEIRIPKPARAGWSFQKFTKRAIDWAIVGAAVQGDQVALVHMGSTPLRATAVEQALAGGAAPADAAAHAADGTSPPEDNNADREDRGHLARVLVARGLAGARSRAWRPGARPRPDHLRGEEAGQRPAASVLARRRDACGHGLAGAGVVAQSLDQRDQFGGLEEHEAAVPEVVGQAAELLAPDR